MPLRRGHLAMLVAAGFLDNLCLEANGHRLLVKGRTAKELVLMERTRDQEPPPRSALHHRGRPGPRHRRHHRHRRLFPASGTVPHGPVVPAQEQRGRVLFARHAIPRRYPLADYVKQRMPGCFDLLIGDEVHEYKGRGSAQGLAAGILADACGTSLALTGTLAGGYASTLFHLL